MKKIARTRRTLLGAVGIGALLAVAGGGMALASPSSPASGSSTQALAAAPPGVHFRVLTLPNGIRNYGDGIWFCPGNEPYVVSGGPVGSPHQAGKGAEKDGRYNGWYVPYADDAVPIWVVCAS